MFLQLSVRQGNDHTGCAWRTESRWGRSRMQLFDNDLIKLNFDAYQSSLGVSARLPLNRKTAVSNAVNWVSFVLRKDGHMLTFCSPRCMKVSPPGISLFRAFRPFWMSTLQRGESRDCNCSVPPSLTSGPLAVVSQRISITLTWGAKPFVVVRNRLSSCVNY